ncbi:single-stranded DNA-binding protein [Arthrobacter sp. GMC3]|uniref:single-stranded DNA-binding protein n=1 Tax=Arthrobacter sp. GMC3 TaxID=2058894 RepID=UPI000CE31A9E|nr:single-stranded DNA-binding protein [Arthrobacter sp. GMC3]
MAGETTITVIGNLTGDPELRFAPSGKAVANFTIASTPRTFDRQSNEWKDGETLFLRASIWNEPAENVAESLTKGTRVIVSGRLKSRTYDTKEGEKRTVMDLEVDEIGPSLRYANAKVNRTQRGGQGGGNNHGSQESGTFSNQQGQQSSQFGNFGDQQNRQNPAGQPQNSGWGGSQPAQNAQTGNNLPPTDPWGNGPSDPPF